MRKQNKKIILMGFILVVLMAGTIFAQGGYSKEVDYKPLPLSIYQEPAAYDAPSVVVSHEIDNLPKIEDVYFGGDGFMVGGYGNYASALLSFDIINSGNVLKGNLFIDNGLYKVKGKIVGSSNAVGPSAELIELKIFSSKQGIFIGTFKGILTHYHNLNVLRGRLCPK